MVNAYYRIAALFLIFSACKKDKQDPEPLPAPTTVTYLVEFTNPLLDTTANALLKYVDGDGVLQTATDFIPGSTSWTKTVTVTNTSRPITFLFKTEGTTNDVIYFTGSSTVSSYIKVNNQIKAFSIESTIDFLNAYRDILYLSHTLQ